MATAAATAADEPTVAMEEPLGKEDERIDEPAETMDQIAEEREEAGDPAEAMEQIEEEPAEPADPMEQVEEEHVEAAEPADPMEQEEAVAEAEAEEGASLRPTLPVGRVKRIMRVDRDIKKVTSEATLLIAAATELFLGSLASGAYTAAARRGRRTVRAAHVRAAARAHRPTADFLLDCLHAEVEAPRAHPAAGSAGGGGGREAKPLPRGTRRIDAFFQKVT
ncbi:nuclear transcription factor Y subunit C-2-like [Panicum virgatum]|nr:nuclear transcription factor Y subunit C-2-like [Panicum virgatum]